MNDCLSVCSPAMNETVISFVSTHGSLRSAAVQLSDSGLSHMSALLTQRDSSHFSKSEIRTPQKKKKKKKQNSHAGFTHDGF